jgi:hypothetical protein
MTLSIMTFSITIKSTTLSIVILISQCCNAECQVCFIVMLSVVRLNIFRLSGMMLTVMVSGTQPMRQSHDIQHNITQNDYK